MHFDMGSLILIDESFKQLSVSIILDIDGSITFDVSTSFRIG
jgi:hypothetical protein